MNAALSLANKSYTWRTSILPRVCGLRERPPRRPDACGTDKGIASLIPPECLLIRALPLRREPHEQREPEGDLRVGVGGWWVVLG